MPANTDARFALSCKRHRSSRTIKLMPRSFCSTLLFVSLIACSPFRFAAILPRPEPSEGHPFVFIDFRTSGPRKISTPLFSIACALFAQKYPDGTAPLLIIRHALLTHSLEISPVFAALPRNGMGTYPSISIQSPFWLELYFPLAPVRDSPLEARTLLPVLFDCASNSQEPSQ